MTHLPPPRTTALPSHRRRIRCRRVTPAASRIARPSHGRCSPCQGSQARRATEPSPGGRRPGTHHADPPTSLGTGQWSLPPIQRLLCARDARGRSAAAESITGFARTRAGGDREDEDRRGEEEATASGFSVHAQKMALLLN
jgi:hypothetical protein